MRKKKRKNVKRVPTTRTHVKRVCPRYYCFFTSPKSDGDRSRSKPENCRRLFPKTRLFKQIKYILPSPTSPSPRRFYVRRSATSRGIAFAVHIKLYNFCCTYRSRFRVYRPRTRRNIYDIFFLYISRPGKLSVGLFPRPDRTYSRLSFAVKEFIVSAVSRPSGENDKPRYDPTLRPVCRERSSPTKIIAGQTTRILARPVIRD